MRVMSLLRLDLGACVGFMDWAGALASDWTVVYPGRLITSFGISCALGARSSGDFLFAL